MKNIIKQCLAATLTQLNQNKLLNIDIPADFIIDTAKNKDHGDFATNVAMILAKKAKMKPRDLAKLIVDHFVVSAEIEKIEIAGPGFINFFVVSTIFQNIIKRIQLHPAQFGQSNIGQQAKIQVEFVSANPTGPLHVGHGRGAAYGATISNLLEAIGYDVHREYYVNDAGRQMDILATSVWLRYLELCGETFEFPSNGYQGDYIWDIGASLHREHGDVYFIPIAQVHENVPADAPDGDKEKHIDGLIAAAKKLLGDHHYRFVHELGLNSILDNIKADLKHFGVIYDDWFSEKSLTEKGCVNHAVDVLRNSGYLYEKEGAYWFKSTEFGDEKDRVVIRENGQTTYFASDIAYHLDKFERGYSRVIDVWGADHHGYIPRVKAALTALGQDASKLDVLLVQFANLYRGGEKVQMSTRSGEFVSLRQLRKDVGNDAARFFYTMRKCEQHLDFDLDLAKSQTNENPMYYIQYAHARVCSIARLMKEKNLSYDQEQALQYLPLLTQAHELKIIIRLNQFEETIQHSAIQYEPHQLTHYLRELANDFHTYYNDQKVLVEDSALRQARYILVDSVRITIANGLNILGVSAPDEM